MARTPRLNREMIVREAIALLGESGLEAVSLRRLAERLGVKAPSLARHVGDKGQLLALLSAAIFGDALDTIPAGLNGDGWLEAFGNALRRKQSETRDIAGLFSVVPPDPEVHRAINERLSLLMREAGLEGDRAQVEQAAIQALVTGWMMFEKSPRANEFAARLPSDHAFEDSLRALIAGFAAER
ncbi:MAG: TetR family transcriptional regulator [Candidatus Andeanibacterium colombiense]|uniref:TetR family transcriptional regulator n=1 Tax=Candidatus Andeanibacterium colombiense TaxID=3121345 RepID=A0AAJ5X7B2_9SPHN|nr:MAG: TetR family transcriptional regulator [Sphingomonadaceae bacterium]